MATTFARIEEQARVHLKELATLSTPSAPTITNVGTAGATAYSYKVVAMHRHGASAASTAGSTATGNATLTAGNYNNIAWTAVDDATAYVIYRTVGGTTQGVIGIVGEVTAFRDTGLTGDDTDEPTVNTSGGNFWSSAELLDIMTKGAQDMWGAIIDLNQEHFETIDETNMSIAASSSSVTGVPTDLFRVSTIEPRDTTSSGASRNVRFTPAKTNDWRQEYGRASDAVDPTVDQEIYYTLRGAGSPVAAPTIEVRPKLTSALNLRVIYVPTLPWETMTAATSNPIPGEADNALIAWTVAYARAKEREDHSPDPSWLTIYGTEKQNILVRLTPRQTQEPEVVEDFFDAYN